MNHMPRFEASKALPILLVAGLVVGAASVGGYALFRNQTSPSPYPNPRPDSGQPGDEVHSAPRLVGASGSYQEPPPAESAAEAGPAPADLEAILRTLLPNGWTGHTQFGLRSDRAQRVVDAIPGGIEALALFCLDTASPAPYDLGTYASRVVSASRMDSTLRVELRTELAQKILTALEVHALLAPYQVLAALEWLWRLDFDGQAFDRARSASALFIAADALLRSHHFYVHRALARLEIDSTEVRRSLLASLGEASWAHLFRFDVVLQDEHILALARGAGRDADDALLAKLETSEGTSAVWRIALLLRIARGDPWDVVHRRLATLAATRMSGNTYCACLREAIAYQPTPGMQALPALLRLRPDMRLSEASVLIDRSLQQLRSVEQLAGLVASGRLYWDLDLKRITGAP